MNSQCQILAFVYDAGKIYFMILLSHSVKAAIASGHVTVIHAMAKRYVTVVGPKRRPPWPDLNVEAVTVRTGVRSVGLNINATGERLLKIG